MNPVEMIQEFNKQMDEVVAFSKIHWKTFKYDLLPIIKDSKDKKLLRMKWEYLAGDIQIPLQIIDDDGNVIMETPGLIDTKVIERNNLKGDNLKLTDKIMATKKSTQFNDLRKDLNSTITKLPISPEWSKFIYDFENKFGTIEDNDIEYEKSKRNKQKFISDDEIDI